MKLSYSQIKTWKRCRRKWCYNYQEKLTPKQRVAKIDLGSYVHALLEEHYNGIVTTQEASAKYFDRMVSQAVDEEDMEHFRQIQAEAEAIVENYKRYYADSEWRRVIATEKEFLVKIPGTDIEFRLIVDMLVEDQDGLIWIVDHKVTSIGFEDWGESLILDEQANLYLWALQQHGYKVEGVIFNLIRAKLPKQPAILKSGGLSKAKNIDTDYDTYMAAIMANGLDPFDYTDILESIRLTAKPFFGRYPTHRSSEEIDLIGEELTSIAKEFAELSQRDDLIPVRTATSNCRWDCPYMQLCIGEAKMLDMSLVKELEFDRRE